MTELLGHINDAINILIDQQKTLYDYITVLREPTPIKVAKILHTDPNGCIGQGLDTNNPETIYQCPMSAEGWIHRIMVTCPEHQPANPLVQGQMWCTGSMGEVIFWLPNTAPISTSIVAPWEIVIEGSKSAPHLSPGESILITGDQLPPGMDFRFDLQIELVTGINQYTPMQSSPSRLFDRDYNGYKPDLS